MSVQGFCHAHAVPLSELMSAAAADATCGISMARVASRALRVVHVCM
jgi:hypothetical protein